MGSSGYNAPRENPLHSVYLSAFFMGETEVTYGEWKSVLAWAKANGYDFSSDGKGITDKHPVTDVNWHDSVKWCNAKSEMEGLFPCFKLDGSVHRGGQKTGVVCDWNANGYRLPTQEEWEKAARGGLVGKTYPNGDKLDEHDANIGGSGTTEVKKYASNGYGLYDMAGNVAEWCWDYTGYYPYPPEQWRATRGGSWDNYWTEVFHTYSLKPDDCRPDLGFRLVRRAGL